MTSFATKLENDARLRERTVTIVLRVMGICAGASVLALISLVHRVF
jgi:hypothetical protein